jgi:hypothetical protein
MLDSEGHSSHPVRDDLAQDVRQRHVVEVEAVLLAAR